MRVGFTVNGVELCPGTPLSEGALRGAGLGRLAPWRRLLRGLSLRHVFWEVGDPRVECFDGAVQVYPCRHGYLDPDRRWGTSCLVQVRGDALTAVEVRVIDGVYAAGNLYDRFVDVCREHLGEPRDEQRDVSRWALDSCVVFAGYQHHDHSAVFRIDAVEA